MRKEGKGQSEGETVAESLPAREEKEEALEKR
jgi:hypothetical protein